jgi:hypothetical protein|tara:strand:+ start:2980 stop:3123 length:144 start_codon:yes stop_codon:yes gene_type:complete
LNGHQQGGVHAFQHPHVPASPIHSPWWEVAAVVAELAVAQTWVVMGF